MGKRKPKTISSIGVFHCAVAVFPQPGHLHTKASNENSERTSVIPLHCFKAAMLSPSSELIMKYKGYFIITIYALYLLACGLNIKSVKRFPVCSIVSVSG